MKSLLISNMLKPNHSQQNNYQKQFTAFDSSSSLDTIGYHTYDTNTIQLFENQYISS